MPEYRLLGPWASGEGESMPNEGDYKSHLPLVLQKTSEKTGEG